MDFKDHFSSQAKEYSKYRPEYPKELFLYLSSIVKEHNTAWDCATGNGQAAIGLEPYFDKIIATDASSSQIKHARLHPKIEYRTVTAENSGLASDSIDLLTVATAIHWFNSEIFFPEVNRIVKNGGVIAVWTYSETMINEEIDKVSEHFTHSIVGKYWAQEIKKAWDFRNKITLPFEKIETPDFEFHLKWDLSDYLNFLYTWSATQNYIKETGKDPIKLFYNDCLSAWKDRDIKRDVKLDLFLKAGRIIK
ncbi:MAG: methyltransferase domain-containing protein [Ignavibacteria bacterium]|nr:methyltransferase domain-containing protein [Ignavibacteria bacterium]